MIVDPDQQPKQRKTLYQVAIRVAAVAAVAVGGALVDIGLLNSDIYRAAVSVLEIFGIR